MRAVRDLKSCCHQRSLCPQIDEGDFQSIALRCGCYAPGTQNIILYVFDVPFLDGKDLRSVPLGMLRFAAQHVAGTGARYAGPIRGAIRSEQRAERAQNRIDHGRRERILYSASSLSTIPPCLQAAQSQQYQQP